MGIGKTRNGEIGNEKPGNGWKRMWKKWELREC